MLQKLHSSQLITKIISHSFMSYLRVGLSLHRLTIQCFLHLQNLYHHFNNKINYNTQLLPRLPHPLLLLLLPLASLPTANTSSSAHSSTEYQPRITTNLLHSTVKLPIFLYTADVSWLICDIQCVVLAEVTRGRQSASVTTSNIRLL
jgi:hypothetical protein